VLVKGRSNYLCRRKLEDRLRRVEERTDEEAAFLRELARWAETTADGSRSDLATPPPQDLWELVRSDVDQTLRSRCPHFQECFFYRARREAAAADVLVVNHHLLVADLNLKREVGEAAGPLPRYEAAVLDEGHHLEEVATSMLATEVTTRGLELRMGRLLPRSKRRKGVIGRLLDRLPPEEQATAQIHTAVAEKLRPAVRSLRKALPLVSGAVIELLRHAAGEAREGRDVPPYRMPPRLDAIPRELQPLVEHVETLASLLGGVSRALGGIRDRLEELPEAWQEQELQLRFDLRSAHDRLTGAIRDLGAVVEEDPERCRWIESVRGKDGTTWPRFCTAPIEVGPRVRAVVLDPLRAVVLTSATLTVDRRFSHLRDRIGVVDGTLVAERAIGARYDSPFDFTRQVYLAVPDDMPDPGSPDYTAAVEDRVCRLVEAAGGRTFVLFTSYRMLRRVHRVARERLPGLRFLAQGTLERGRLLQEFRAGGKAVLLGTDSFWEGVDVPGQALSLVVLTRLPFRVPTEPVQRARAERIELRGGDAFLEYSVPQAVIRFRQGFGRLIRSRRDRGAVVVLDPRVVTRRYGGIFVRSLPPVKVRRLGTEAVVDGVRAFLQAE